MNESNIEFPMPNDCRKRQLSRLGNETRAESSCNTIDNERALDPSDTLQASHDLGTNDQAEGSEIVAPSPEEKTDHKNAINQSLTQQPFKVPHRFEYLKLKTNHHTDSAGQKRSLQGQENIGIPTSGSSGRKRARTDLHFPRSFERPSFAQAGSDPCTPPSPLFFSNSPNVKPRLLQRFTSSDAAVKMIKMAHEEETSVRTVTLPRGLISVSSTSPYRTPTPTRPLFEKSNSARNSETPETGGVMDSLRVLGQIGITELLEHDQRPAFVIDLASVESESTSTFRIVYTNPAVHAIAGLFDLISGKKFNDGIDESERSLQAEYEAFKGWTISNHQEEQVFDMKIPVANEQNISWSALTLRRRIRIITGHLLALTSARGPGAKIISVTPSPAVTSANSFGLPAVLPTPLRQPERTGLREPLDYFSGVPIDNANLGTNIAERDMALPSIERATSQHDDMDTQIDDMIVPRSIFHDAARERASSELLSTTASSSDVRFCSTGELLSTHGFFDWTRLPSSEDLPEHIKFARNIDWGKTPLGPMETWSADLRQMCNLIMASPHPAAMYWGDEHVAIYNEAYVLLAGQKHPELMGCRYQDAWAEIWDDVREAFAEAHKTAQATMKDDDCLFIKRGNIELEEAYFSWSIIPIVGADGSVKGLYNPAFEKTRRRIAERRMLTLREVGERTAAARDQSGFWAESLTALGCNEHDTPFVILYSLSDENDSDDSSMHSSSLNAPKQCILEGALGVPAGHEAIPDTVDLRTSSLGFIPYFRDVLKTNKPELLDVTRGDFPSRLLEGLQWRGFGDPCTAVIICPIHPTTSEESTLGFLVMGINPRRPYDDDYALFIQLLSRQLATSLASVVLFEREIKRGQRAAKLAALDRIELSEQLAARTQEAIESEFKFSTMAEFAPVGMFITNSEGRMTYCNDTWYDISRVPRDVHRTEKWIEYVFEPDQEPVQRLWHDLVTKTKPCNAEFRFKAPWTDSEGTICQTWVLFSAYPQRNEEGGLKNIFGSITDISQQKWAERFQKRKTEEAIELKRQQENFIDMTSHEMRNPLSAILQCSDEIVANLTEARSRDTNAVDDVVISENIDAAQTIALCAQHQKRIVDDVLTLSKLDSQLLMVTPVDVQPIAVVQRALKMFEGELQTADIDLKFNTHQTYKDLRVDWVRCDPSRVLQILINLVTNSIKFTTPQEQKKITVTIAASLKPPPSEGSKSIVNYFPSRAKRAAFVQGSEWGDGEELYVHFSVEDTGQGLSKEQMKSLFMRFSQASPRTHVQYGGSGLGLFISRELAELQGGEIGVASQAGKGSTFAFYIKARRCSQPEGLATRIQEMVDTRRSVSTRGNGRKGSRKSSTTAAHSPLSNLGILLVEDNMVNQTVLKRQLTHEGFVVHVANHGGEALERIKESNLWGESRKTKDTLDIGIILMDQEMPIMDGITCTRQIRQLESQNKIVRHVPIIGVTANARHGQISSAVEAGMDDVVCKPFRIPELVPKIDELVTKHSIGIASGAL